MLNILPFCIGRLITYYFVAFVTKGVYSTVFIVGWIVFAFLWYILLEFLRKKRGISKIIGVGIIVVSLLSSTVLFERIRIYDITINLVMAYFLFVKKIERG